VPIYSKLLAATVCLSLAAAGCGVSSYYREDGEKAMPGAVSPRQEWIVSGDLDNVQEAIDGSVSTAAMSAPQYAGATITIDLGRPCLFNHVSILHGPNEYGYCRRVAVETSMDGRTFTTRHAAPGNRVVTNVSLITPYLTRYVRIRAVVPGSEPWRVAEILIE